MKADELKQGRRYRTQMGYVVTFTGIADGYDGIRYDGHALVNCLMSGRLYLFSSRDLIEEIDS